jgi:hypothetical protein
MLEQCPVLGWAASGGMALTGAPDGPAMVSPAGAFGMLGQVLDRLAQGSGVRADPSELLAGRAALMGLRRRGRVSAGGSSRLLPTAEGWCAVTLSRRDDVAAVPAILGSLGLDISDMFGSGAGWRQVPGPRARPRRGGRLRHRLAARPP